MAEFRGSAWPTTQRRIGHGRHDAPPEAVERLLSQTEGHAQRHNALRFGCAVREVV